MQLPVSSEAFCEAILAAVRRIPAARRGGPFDALALDFHPWEDTLNLSLHARDEEAPLMMAHGVALADWTLALFAIAHESNARAWPEGRAISAPLSNAFNEAVGDSFDADACLPFFEATAALCIGTTLVASLESELPLTTDFAILLPHADTNRWHLKVEKSGVRLVMIGA